MNYVALQIVQLLFASNGNWKESIRQWNVSFTRLKFAEWRSALTAQIVYMKRDLGIRIGQLGIKFERIAELSYYATFKVRKSESLFYKINACLQNATTCIGLQAEQIFSVNIWLTYFFNFGRGFWGLFLCYFQKLQLLAVKKIWSNFYCIVLLFAWAQKLCLIFLKSYFKLEILIFLSFVVSVLVDMFN